MKICGLILEGKEYTGILRKNVDKIILTLETNSGPVQFTEININKVIRLLDGILEPSLEEMKEVENYLKMIK